MAFTILYYTILYYTMYTIIYISFHFECTFCEHVHITQKQKTAGLHKQPERYMHTPWGNISISAFIGERYIK